MTGILNRWRQFGRRYFWPHLFLGMVAATLGIPGAFSSVTTTDNNSGAFHHLFDKRSYSSFLVVNGFSRHSSEKLGYWHKHAVRSALRQLSNPFNPFQAALSQEHHKALLECLSALLTCQFNHQKNLHHVFLPLIPEPRIYSPGLWVAKVQGIRAGPQFSDLV